MYARFGKKRLETAFKVSEEIKRTNLLLSRLDCLYSELLHQQNDTYGVSAERTHVALDFPP